MAAYKKQNIEINQGSSFKLDIVVRGQEGELYSLAGCTARGQVRSGYADYVSDVIAIFTCTIHQDTGTITISLTDTQTQALDFSKGKWDLELVKADSTVERLVEGSVKISREVTRNT